MATSCLKKECEVCTNVLQCKEFQKEAEAEAEKKSNLQT
jgi:hypothetical protein